MLVTGTRAQSFRGKGEAVPADRLYGQLVALLAEDELRVPGREEDAVVDGVHVGLQELLQPPEVHHERAFLVDGALDRDADPVVVAVERLTGVAGERDEMGRREAQVVLADGDLERV